MEQEIRAVVLGWQKYDKASVINSILGDEVEPDKYFVKSLRKDGEVNGRKITLINTPCWWENYDLQDLPEVVRQELVCSVFLCPAGPHVFLLVINLNLPFTKENRFTIEKHLSLFGERIWRHTIVLLTRPDSVKGKDLQQILQRCGERYHVFDFENKSAGVKELLVKIDDVVAANNKKHFETCDDMLLDILRKRDEIERRAKARQETVQDKRGLLKEINAVALLSELRIVLLGWILSGKSSTGNTIFSNEIFPIRKTQKCTSHTGVVNGRSVTVLDTPGWFKYFSSKLNPENTRAAILESVGQSQQMQFPHVMILVIPIDTSFKTEQKRIITEYMVTFGEDVWRHTIVLFTWGDRFPDISIEQHIESEGEALQWLIQKCRNRFHVFDNLDKNNRDQVTELFQKIDEMVAENSLFCLNPAEENIHETDTQQDEEISLDADRVLQLLQHEFNSRFKEVKSRLKHLGMDFTECTETRSHRSMSDPPSLSADEKLKEMIRREGSRWEVTLMDAFLNSHNPVASLDSHEKVLGWIQRCDEYSSIGYGTSSNISSPEDPETRHKKQFTE